MQSRLSARLSLSHALFSSPSFLLMISKCWNFCLRILSRNSFALLGFSITFLSDVSVHYSCCNRTIFLKRNYLTSFNYLKRTDTGAAFIIGSRSISVSVNEDRVTQMIRENPSHWLPVIVWGFPLNRAQLIWELRVRQGISWSVLMRVSPIFNKLQFLGDDTSYCCAH